MKYIITGGCGFLGSNLAYELLKNKQDVIIFDNLYRQGSEKNLEWLRGEFNIKYIHGDIRNQNDVEALVRRHRPDVIYHLAGQVAMTTSIKYPRMDFEINALGTFNVLESVRMHSPESIIIYSSTNKVYGDIEWARYVEKKRRYVMPDYPKGLPETIPLEFHSPYGDSKGSADQYILDYFRIFGIRTVVFRHSSMYGSRQFSTYDQGWIGWFCQKAVEQRMGIDHPFTISGNGKQVRDLLYVDDLTRLYFVSVKKIEAIKGQAFNIGGGMENSLSLLELFDFLEGELGVNLKYKKLPVRESDQKVFIADISKIKRMTGWQPKVDKEAGIKKMLEWTENNFK